MRKLIFRIHMLSLATFCGLILALASCASERRSTEWGWNS